MSGARVTKIAWMCGWNQATERFAGQAGCRAGFSPGHRLAMAPARRRHLTPPAVVAQMSVVFDAHLGLWIMLYGGRAPFVHFPFGALPPGPVSVKASTPAVTESQVGIHLRYAANPWGPWSDAIPVWPAGIDAVARSEILFDPSAFQVTVDPAKPPWRSFTPKAGFEGAAQPDDMFVAYSSSKTSNFPYYESIPGGEYGVSIWPEAGNPVVTGALVRSKKLYFAMSTLNPYHVVLMSTEVAAQLIEEK